MQKDEVRMQNYFYFCILTSKRIGRAPMSGQRRSRWNRNRWLEAGILRRTAGSAYRCCLPALAGFTPRRRTRPASSMLRISPGPQRHAATREFSSAKADCRKRAPLLPRLARPKKRKPCGFHGGQGGIRTLEALTPTRFPGVLHKPLGHLSNKTNAKV